MSTTKGAAALEVGDILQERYSVERALGKGAFATTYLCHDLEEDRHVAVKAMRLTELDVWKSFELFEREARVLKSLSHNGIPDFYDVFRQEPEGGPSAFFLVQEYVEGRSLLQILEDGDRLAPPEVMQILLGTLDILDHLHNQSPPAYHRDIKPSNIIIRPMGAPVLIDFGSVCDGWREKDEQGSTVAGTHGYMPPEQYMGKVSAASDLYALGATLLHVITGKHPSEFPFDEGRVEVPESLPCSHEVRQLIDRCLETAASSRPQTAAEARAILMAASAPSTNTALVPASSTSQTAMITSSGDHPEVLVLGPPPRDPNGPDQDVYKMLVPDYLSTNLGVHLEAAGSKANSASTGGVLLFLMLFACTGGIWILVIAAVIGGRKKKYQDLFINGIYTQGVVLGSGSSGNNGNVAANSVIFRFEVDGKTYRNATPVGGQGGRFFVAGDPVGLLYDPNDPQNSVIIFR